MDIIENPTPDFWSDIAAHSECATFYHTPAWAKTLAATYPEYHVAPRGFMFDDGTRALMPLLCSQQGVFRKKFRYKSFGFGSYGGPVYTGCWDSVKNEELYRYFTAKRVSLHIDGSPLWPHDLPDYFTKETVSTYALRIDTTADAVWKRFSSGHQRGIKTAQKKGVTVRKASSRADHETYCAIYKDTLERWGDTTIITFPDSLTLSLLAPGNDAVVLWLAEVEDKPVAGIIIFYWNMMAHYWRGASLRGYEDYHANTLLQWTVIQDALAKGYRLYDFAPSGALGGVEEFKRRFGAEKLFFTRGHVRS